MTLRKIFLSFSNGTNAYVKGTTAWLNDSLQLVEIIEGADIYDSSAGAEVLINTNAPHGLAVGDAVRVIDHRSYTPQAADLIDTTAAKLLVMTVPNSTSLTLNLTTAVAGFGGFIGKVAPDKIRSTNLEYFVIGQATTFDPREERVG